MSTLNGMSEMMFRNLAITSVINYWNSNEELVKEYGNIGYNDVFVTWQCKAIENFKAMLGVYRDGDGLYFEFTQHGAKDRCYLDVYKQQTQVVISTSKFSKPIN